MADIQYREAKESDVAGMSKIRAENWGTEEYWNTRITGYLNSQHNPQLALSTRVIYIATDDGKVVGFIAGHLTRRFECDGELQWIDTSNKYRRNRIATELLRLLAVWFVDNMAFQICVDSDPSNLIARQFYKKFGAEDLNKHWLVWRNIKLIIE
jgi:ribosomal protein S18 acetylase RimI-like enzyme